MTALPRLRAPQEDGAILAVPPMHSIGDLLQTNRQRLESSSLFVLGQTLSQRRLAARREVLDVARQYFREAGEPIPLVEAGPLFVAGHQPELFHPGVWAKNFALAGLAARHRGVALNLIVDNDIAKSNLIRFPVETTSGSGLYHLQSLPFDRLGNEAPYEERVVRDESLFSSTADRFQELTKSWPFQAMLPKFWQEAADQARRTPFMGERFTAARRAFERRWGCHNLEMPISRMCATDAFATFACHLLSNLPGFHSLYNQTVQDYRARHGLKSQNHPVPDLARAGDWLEAPFWAWRVGQERRGRLFARLFRERVELKVGEALLPSLPSPREYPVEAIGAWRDLERAGWKIRSRALTTTLFARLFLADLFIHGIGGGKYDELTDALMQPCLEPPKFLVLTATVLLPFPRTAYAGTSGPELRRQARDLVWNPQRHMPSADGRFKTLIEEKQNWIQRRPLTRTGRRERFERLRSFTEQLGAFVKVQQEETASRLTSWEERSQSEAVLRRRDFAFCLYPEERLRRYYAEFM